MSLFLSPHFLWGLLFLLPVVALYFLKSKPVRKVVSSTIIWKVVLERIKPNSFFQRFQNSLFLLLQLLAILLLVLAAARPSASWFGQGMKRILIVDVSASMMSEDVEPSRFHRAIDRAVALCRQHQGKYAIFSLSDRLSQEVGWTESSAEAIAGVQRLEVTHCATPSRDRVLRMLRSLEGLGADEAYVLTDTIDLDIPASFMPQTAFFVETFGTRTENVALVGAEVAIAAEPGQIAGSLVVMNGNNKFVDVQLEIDGEPVEGFPVKETLSPRQSKTVVLPVIPRSRATIRVKAPADANANPGDDVWYLCEPKFRARLFLQAPAHSILFRLAQALPLVDVEPYVEGVAPPVGSALLKKGDAPEEPAQIPAAYFVIGSGSVAPGGILPWDVQHEVLRFVDWDAAPVEGLTPGNLPGRPLLESIQGTLIAEASQNEEKQKPRVFVAFDPDHPGFQNQLFLPIFLYNLVDYLLKEHFPRMSYTIGSPRLITLFKGTSPQKAGMFELPNGAGTIAINLQNPSEAAIAPAGPRSPNQIQRAVKSEKDERASPWRSILGVAFLVFIAEWVLFMRKA